MRSTSEPVRSKGSGGAAPAGYEALLRRYARFARHYEQRFARYSERSLAMAMRVMDLDRARRVVDVACGTGLLARQIRRQWPHISVIGVDVSEAMLDEARRHLPQVAASDHAGAIAWRVGQAEALPVESGWADTVVCTNAFHLVQDPESALAEMRRVLQPGGRLVIVDWCRDDLRMRLMLPVLSIVTRQRRRVWRLDELAGAIGRSGFSVIHRERFSAGAFWGLMALAGERTGASPDEPSAAPHVEQGRTAAEASAR